MKCNLKYCPLDTIISKYSFIYIFINIKYEKKFLYIEISKII